MALIGSIAINMKVVTTKLVKGLAAGQGALAKFAVSASRVGKSIGRMLLGSHLVSGPLHLFRRSVIGAVDSLVMFAGAMRGPIKVTREFIKGLGKLAAVAGGIAAYSLYKLVKGAANSAEQADRTRIIFGKFADSVIKESALMAEAFGVSQSGFQAAASAFGAIFQGVGYTDEAAAKLSIHFVRLATDLSSLAHIPVQEALEKIQSGLAGQVRPLREVGVFMSEEAIKSKAAAMGIAKLGAELTESQKVQARVAFITEALAKAQGNLALTASSVANQTRGVAGRIENLSDTIGNALLPIVGTALSDLQLGIEALSLAWQDWTAGAVSSQVGVVGAVGETAQSMGWLQKSVGFVADAFQTLKLGFYAAQSYITFGLSIIVKSFGDLASVIDFAVEKLTGFKLGLGDYIKTFGDDLTNLSQVQWEKFTAELAKPPSSEGISKYFEQAQQRIKDLRIEAAKPVDIAGLAPATAASAKAPGAPKFASAASAYSAEAANSILRSRFGGGGQSMANAPAKQTATNTKKSADLLSQAVQKLDAIARQKAGDAANAFAAALAGNF